MRQLWMTNRPAQTRIYHICVTLNIFVGNDNVQEKFNTHIYISLNPQAGDTTVAQRRGSMGCTGSRKRDGSGFDTHLHDCRASWQRKRCGCCQFKFLSAYDKSNSSIYAPKLLISSYDRDRPWLFGRCWSQRCIPNLGYFNTFRSCALWYQLITFETRSTLGFTKLVWRLISWKHWHHYTPAILVSPCPSVCPSARPSVRLWTESCLLCIFHNNCWINSIFIIPSSNVRKYVTCEVFAKFQTSNIWKFFFCCKFETLT